MVIINKDDMPGSMEGFPNVQFCAASEPRSVLLMGAFYKVSLNFICLTCYMRYFTTETGLRCVIKDKVQV